MTTFQTSRVRLSGTRFDEVHKKARRFFDQIKKKTKRRPYVRSAYFSKEKIFFDQFWAHQETKSRKIRTIRFSYLPCAVELIEHSHNAPTIKINPNKTSELLYRFAGLTKDKEIFYVQIKENQRTRTKYLMSVFPPE